MRSDRIMQSKIYRLFDYVLRLVLLNVLIVVPSFSLFIIYSAINKSGNNHLTFLLLIPMLLWLFPSIVATTDVIRQYEDDETNTIFKDFFKSFAKHFIKSFIIGIVIYLLAMLFYNSFNYFYINQGKGITYLIGLIVTISFIFVVVYLIIHLPLVLVYFSDLTLLQYIKLALIMAFKDFGTTFLMAIIAIIVGTLSILFNYVMFFGGISLTVYLCVKLSYKHYIKIYRKVEKE